MNAHAAVGGGKKANAVEREKASSIKIIVQRSPELRYLSSSTTLTLKLINYR